MRAQLLTALLISLMLAGCTSHPVKPVLPHASHPVEPVPSQVSYWENPQWINDLGTTINDNLVYPANIKSSSHNAAHAVVQFIYDNGQLSNVRILKSTGNQILDSAIVTQLQHIKPPPAEGGNINLSKVFQLPITLEVPVPQFSQSILLAINSQKYYPMSALMNNDQGLAIVDFQYRNGEIVKSSIYKSTGSRVLDKAVLNILADAKMPMPPPWAHNKMLHFRVELCWGIYESPSNPCHYSIIEIRYVSGNISTPHPVSDCALVGYDYKDGEIADIHIVNSSGDTDQDKTALLTVTRGNFPQPPTDLRSTESGFLEPVCASHKAVPQHPAKAP